MKFAETYSVPVRIHLTRVRGFLYRSLLRDRRTLVVLDNAASEEQVRPLLPGRARAGL